MGSGGVAAVSEERECVSAMDMIVGMDLDAPILQMRIGDVAIRRNLKNDVVSGNVVEGDMRQSRRSVVWDSVHHFGDLSVGDGEDGFAPSPPVVILSAGCAVVTGIPVGADFDPVNGEAFCGMRVSVDGGDGTAMVGVIHRALPGEPGS